MGTAYPEVFAALAAPFSQGEVKRRSQAGREFDYISARTAANRLDSVLGPESWKPEFQETPKGAVQCRIWYRLEPDGEWLWKEDGGAAAGMAEADNDAKSGYSDAFKRAAAMLGVGRYLYKDGTPDFGGDYRGSAPQRESGRPENRQAARYRDDGYEEYPDSRRQPAHQPSQNGNGSGRGYDERPQRRDDRDYRDEPRQHDRSGNGGYSSQNGNGNGNGGSSAPRSGRALFAWLKEQEQKHDVVLLRYMNNWAKLHEFPARMVDWDDKQAAMGHKEALRKLDALTHGSRADAEVESMQDSSAPSDGGGRGLPTNDPPRGDGARPDPTTGRALFAWLKDTQAHVEMDLVGYVAKFGMGLGFPGRIVDWNPEQAVMGLNAARQKMGFLAGGPGARDSRDVPKSEPAPRPFVREPAPGREFPASFLEFLTGERERIGRESGGPVSDWDVVRMALGGASEDQKIPLFLYQYRRENGGGRAIKLFDVMEKLNEVYGSSGGPAAVAGWVSRFEDLRADPLDVEDAKDAAFDFIAGKEGAEPVSATASSGEEDKFPWE